MFNVFSDFKLERLKAVGIFFEAALGISCSFVLFSLEKSTSDSLGQSVKMKERAKKSTRNRNRRKNE